MNIKGSARREAQVKEENRDNFKERQNSYEETVQFRQTSGKQANPSKAMAQSQNLSNSSPMEIPPPRQVVNLSSVSGKDDTKKENVEQTHPSVTLTATEPKTFQKTDLLTRMKAQIEKVLFETENPVESKPNF